VRDDLPAGTVTLVFTDIEGSTKLLHELGAKAYSEALAEHRRLLREAYQRHGGVEVDTQGDAFFFAFRDASEAVAAAEEGREALRYGRIHVRVGIHTGTPHLGPEGYVGQDVHLGARIGAAGHGRQVLLSQATRAAARLADDALHDLGEHRLKDFERPVPIFQLGAERFPPLKTISNTNLPRPASSFVGRERETEDIVRLIRGDGARLVTLTGPGGSGKTRLSIEAAAELVGDHKAGTFWVELAPVRDPALLTDEIGKTVGASDGLADHIGEREMLLVLDNLEQVINVGPTLADLVESCPNVAVLATSRERLRVRGEVEYEVRPLAESDAVDLFVARAGLAAPDDAVRKLCHALDEMPLAIELAAARAKVLGPEQILERLSQRLDLFTGGRDADPRQRTLRSTIEWSHDLLGPGEQRLFARLAVFAGGATLEAAEAVADADLDTLGSLVEKSLLRRTDDRFWMYETIREFALERLGATGEAADLRRRHADHYLELAETAEPHLRREDDDWIDRLQAELDNVRAALDHFEVTEQHALQLRLCASFWWVWSLRGPQKEGLRRLQAPLVADRRPTMARANALTGASDLAWDAGDYAASHSLGEEALALHRALGNDWGVAYEQLGLGLALAIEDRFAEAKPLFEESVRGFRELGDEHWEMQASRRLAWSYEELGDLPRARRIHEENVRRARDQGDEFIEARSLSVLGTYHLEEGRVEPAIPLLAEAHRLHQGRTAIPDRYQDVILLCRFARALVLRGEAAATIRLLSCAEAGFEELEINEGKAEGWIVRMNERTQELIGSTIDEATAATAAEEGRKLTVDEAVTLALTVLRSDSSASQQGGQHLVKEPTELGGNTRDS
jgi:predicted ATPase/class 3 adenylate cyclase